MPLQSQVRITLLLCKKTATVSAQIGDLPTGSNQTGDCPQMQQNLGGHTWLFLRVLPIKSRLPIGTPFQRRMLYVVAAWK